MGIALGMIELLSIARGIETCDFMDAAETILKDQMLFASARPFVPYLEAAKKHTTYGFDAEIYEKVMWKKCCKRVGNRSVSKIVVLKS